MRTRIKTILILISLTLSLFAQEQLVCEKSLGSGASLAYITCATDSLGRVVISISAASGAESATVFRGNALAPAGFKYDGQVMEDYFTRSVQANKQIIYTPNPDVTIETGKLITFNRGGEGVNTEWKTEQNDNAYTASFSFSYSYGSNCSKLATPVIDDINDGVIIFEPDPNATSFVAYVYLNGVLKYSQEVMPYDLLEFTSLLNGVTNYEVTLVARSTNMLDSDESAPFTWALSGTAPTVGNSEYCQYRIGSAGSEAFLTWETLANGDVEINISGNEAYFRGNGMGAGLSGFTVGSAPASTYFSRVYANTNPTSLTLHLKDPAVTPVPGEKISFKSGTVEWKTSANSNAYGTYTFNYTYGSVCQTLETPVLTAISADSVPQFTLVEGATSYYAQVYLNGVLKYFQTIQPGDKLHFQPDQDGTYQVTLIARANGLIDSDESSPVDWVLTAIPVELGNSEYCAQSFSSGNTKAYLSWQTLDNGDVEISISGDDGTWFRANGMGGTSLSNFTVDGVSAFNYFERRFDGNKALTYTLHLKDPNLHPALGAQIRFNGTVEWCTAKNSNAYGTYTFTYTYGTSCPQMERPTISSIDASGIITLQDSVPDAAGYRVYIYRGELLVSTQTLTSPLAPLQFQLNTDPLTATYNYTVYVQTIGPAGTVPSALSEPYLWRVDGHEEELGVSEVCSRNIASGIRLTITTSEHGAIVCALSGSAGATWRAAGLKSESLTIMGYPLENFFRKQLNDSVLTFAPRGNLRGVIFDGDMIIYNDNMEWQTPLNSNAYQMLSFTYTYGTTCEIPLPRLDAPADVQVTDEGEVSFSPVENAASYETRVADIDWDILAQQALASGDTILRERSILSEFTYYVAVRALPADVAVYRPSRWSTDVAWVPSYMESIDPFEPGTSEPGTPGGYEDPDSPSDPPIVFPDDVALEDIVLNAPFGKFIHRGQVYIFCRGHIFTLLGQIIR